MKRMEMVLISGLQQGLIYGFMALGVLLTFCLLGFPDLTVEGTFPLGAATTATAVMEGFDPIPAVLLGAMAGALAGAATGLMHTKLKVNNILAGILTTSGIYTVMLWAMGRPNISLLNKEDFFTQVLALCGITSGELSLRAMQISIILILFLMVAAARLLLGWFLRTDLGLTIRAAGNNEKMLSALGVDVNQTKLLTLILANFLVGLSGALECQLQGFADVGLGIGVLVAAIASVMLGIMLFGRRSLSWLLTGVILGSILYRGLLALGLWLKIPAENFKLVTAVLVLIVLTLPNISVFNKKAAPRSNADALAQQGPIN
jgi:putative ABC transport system permease protein